MSNENFHKKVSNESKTSEQVCDNLGLKNQVQPD